MEKMTKREALELCAAMWDEMAEMNCDNAAYFAAKRIPRCDRPTTQLLRLRIYSARHRQGRLFSVPSVGAERALLA